MYRNGASLIILLWALFMFGCNEGKQVSETSPQKAKTNEEKAPVSGKQQSETKDKSIGNAPVVKKFSQLETQPVTEERNRIAGRYVNEKKPSTSIEISNNGTYMLQNENSFIGGNYVLDGNHITLFGPGQPFEGKIEGVYIIGSTGSRFVKRR